MKKTNRVSKSEIRLKAGFIFEVTDDSMKDVNIKKGNRVYVKYINANQPFKNGTIVAVQIWGQVFLRKFYQRGSIVLFKPACSNCAGLKIDTREDNNFEIIGKADGLVRQCYTSSH